MEGEEYGREYSDQDRDLSILDRNLSIDHNWLLRPNPPLGLYEAIYFRLVYLPAWLQLYALLHGRPKS